MPAAALALVLTALNLQEPSVLDVPVYQNAAYGVALPRPFGDWVFAPGTSRQTTTVIFHPRDASLREQLWGALVMTPYPGSAPIGQLADQRVASAWQPTLGPGFTLLAQDSISVDGFPAIHIVMGGSIDRAVLDVEEYVIARDTDLILLQFRYPRGLPRDSIAAGYQRVFDGLRLRGARTPPPFIASVTDLRSARAAMWRALAGSPWRMTDVDALVRFDTAGPRLDFSVRLELVNESPVPQESAVVWLPPGFSPDSVRNAMGRTEPLAGTGELIHQLAVGWRVPPLAGARLTLFYRLVGGPNTGPGPSAATGVRLGSDGAHVAGDWMPRVRPITDSAGHAVPVTRPRRTVRFDLPVPYRAAAAGRLTSEGVAVARRRMAWTEDEVPAAVPGFAIGRYQALSRRAGRLRVGLWLEAEDRDTAAASRLDSLVQLIGRGWSVYSRAFGPLPLTQIQLVAVESDSAFGFPGLLLLGRRGGYFGGGGAPPGASWRDAVLRELARTWWGHAIGGAGPGSAWLQEGFAAWAAIAARGILEGDSVRQRLVREAERDWRLAASAGDPGLLAITPESAMLINLLRTKGAAALEAARRAAGEARFREAIRTFAQEGRHGWVTADRFLPLLGPDGAAVLRPYLGAR